MSFTPQALAGLGLAMAVLAEEQPEDQDEADLLTLTGLGLFAAQVVLSSNTMPMDDDLLGDNSDDEEHDWYDYRGPYNILKSSDTLPIMLEHTNDAWFRQFFRYVP